MWYRISYEIPIIRAAYRIIRVASARPLERRWKHASRFRKERCAAKYDIKTTYYQSTRYTRHTIKAPHTHGILSNTSSKWRWIFICFVCVYLYIKSSVVPLSFSFSLFLSLAGLRWQCFLSLSLCQRTEDQTCETESLVPWDSVSGLCLVCILFFISRDWSGEGLQHLLGATKRAFSAR